MLSNSEILTNDPLADPALKAIVDGILAESQDLPGATMVVLEEIQGKVGYVSDSIQQYVAAKLKIPVSIVHGVISFYSFFTTAPRGRHTIRFCLGTACYVGGMPQLIEKAKQVLGVEPGQTTKDGSITLEVCRCVGACSQAPVIVIDEDVNGRVRPNKLPQLFRPVQNS
ncbi:MAG TPA: NAD(P)H-dependent oxidoreductase subunit E [Anaerolineaceae bacterium]|nr:NAD(P)H-dependent oxidoreductase subunit E [Anaerolineaceae bacterium]